MARGGTSKGHKGHGEKGQGYKGHKGKGDQDEGVWRQSQRAADIATHLIKQAPKGNGKK